MSQFRSKTLGEVRLKFFDTPVDYFYYELFVLDGNKYRNEDLDEDEGEEDLISSRIKNQTSPTIQNTIQFVYKNEVVSRRQLTDAELNELVKLLRVLEFKLLPNQDDPVWIIPDLSKKIQLETAQIYIEYWWLTSDGESSKNDLRNLMKLTEMIHNLLDVDTSGLDMPVYK